MTRGDRKPLSDTPPPAGPGRGAPARGEWLVHGLLVAACLVLFLAGTGRQSVFDRDEARFALAVKEMSQRGDWIVPSNWGEPRYNKPILCYWLALASTRVFGMNETALRLPSALCCIVTVLVTMAIARRRYGRRTAWIAGGVIATALFLVIEARVLTADASLLAATTVSFWAWARLRERPARPARWQFLFWTGVGLGMLAKVVNVVFLASAACALALLRGLRTRRARTAFGAAWGIPLAVALFAAWGIPAALRTHGAFAIEGIGHHLLGRVVTPFEGHSGWPGYYLLATPLAMFPWGSLLPAAIRNAWQQRSDVHVQFLLAWVLGPLVVVELTASKLPHYMLVTFPALAILVARLIDARTAAAGPTWRGARIFEAVGFALVCVVIASLAGYLAWKLDSPAIVVRARAVIAVASAIGVAGAYCWIRRSPVELAAFLAASAAALYLVLFALFVPALEPQRLSPQLGAAVGRLLQPGERLVLCRLKDASIGFYLPRAPDLKGDPDAVAAALRSDSRTALVLVPADDDGRVLAKLRDGDDGRWQELAMVRGILPVELAMRRVLIVRREAAVPTSRPP